MTTTNQTISTLVTEQLTVLDQAAYHKSFRLLGASLRQKEGVKSSFTLILLLTSGAKNKSLFFNIARSIKNHIDERNGIPCEINSAKTAYQDGKTYGLVINFTVDMDSEQAAGGSSSIPVNRLLNIRTISDSDPIEDIREVEFEAINESASITISKLLANEQADTSTSDEATYSDMAELPRRSTR